MNILPSKHYVNIFLAFCLIVFAGIVCKWGILPAINNTKGDFANYYTASSLIIDGISLETAYRDFVWFQKQMDRYGIVNQVGGFIPFPPSTALVLLPLALFSPVTAKNIWVLFNIVLVVIDIVLLCRISRLPWLMTSVLFFGSGYALLNQFLFGQQYLLLLTSILLGIYFHQKQKPVLSGMAFGVFIPIKYVGVLFLFYFAWKKQWRLVGAAIVTVVVVLSATLVLGGWQVFQTFATEVLPRHLRGEIQDPYSVFFQSWNSLFRRLFVYQESLNTDPALNMPALFYIFKHVVFWCLLGLASFIIVRIRFQNERHLFLFHMGFIPLVLLLISPVSATYHFLLLILSGVCFTKILIDVHRPLSAAFLTALFVMVNLPLFIKVQDFAHGWLNPVAFPRLWLLLSFFLFVIYLFRGAITWQPLLLIRWWLPVFCMVSVFIARDLFALSAEVEDEGHYLRIDRPESLRHFGLVLNKPDVGKDIFVFSELVDEHYAIYSNEGNRWTPRRTQNFYNPDLAGDDTSLLAESVVNGRLEIWLSHGPGKEPVFMQAGQSPSWHPDGDKFAFIRKVDIHLSDIHSGALLQLTRNPVENAYDLAFSPDGEYLVFCAYDGRGTSLHKLSLSRGSMEVLLQSPYRIESPAWSPDGDRVLFSWNPTGNRDIWAMDLLKKQTVPLTSHRAEDTDPVWDAERQRILFVSDRGRGLEFSTIYWIPIPEEWQKAR